MGCEHIDTAVEQFLQCGVSQAVGTGGVQAAVGREENHGGDRGQHPQLAAQRVSADQSVRVEGGESERVQRLIEYFLRCPFSQMGMVEVTCLRRGFGRQAEEGKVLYKTGHNRLGRFPEAASQDLLAGPKRNCRSPGGSSPSHQACLAPGYQGIGASGESQVAQGVRDFQPGPAAQRSSDDSGARQSLPSLLPPERR